MPTPNCRLDRPNFDANNGADLAIHILRRQQWNYVVGAAKGIDWFSYGLPGWDAAFTGTYPEFSRATFTEEGATGRIIQIDYTYTAGVLDGMTVQFDDADGGGLQPILAPDRDLLAGDRVAYAPSYNYVRPYQTYNIGGGAAGDGDDFAIRDNFLAMTCIAMCETDDPQNYHFPGMTFTPTLRADGKLEKMLMAVTAWTLEIEIDFTHYEDDLYNDGIARVRTIEIKIKRYTGEAFHTIGKFLYTRRGNGAVRSVTQMVVTT